MKKAFKLLPLAVVLPVLAGINANKGTTKVSAADTLYARNNLPTTINLNDYEAADIRNYYSALNGKDEAERKGDNLLKNLKPILSNGQKYYDYDYGQAVWQMYEITDRDWTLSPATAITNGTYDPATNIITGYTYGTTKTSATDAANPYIHSYYMDYSQPNQVKAWGNHNQDGYGINREHLWPKSHGFDDDSSGAGARGDPFHLVAANGCVNREHNNNFYGYVDKDASSTYDCKVKFFDSVGHNYVGPSKTHPTDGVKVFEPQDKDKGDIARAIFYMAARYNNIAGDDSTIGGANPNLVLTNDLTKYVNKGYTSTPTSTGFMAVLDDLLEWNEIDPVDEYEIHRNNLLYRNYTFNRNPFIDFPEWANLIWGESTKVADPSRDPINGGNPNTISDLKVENINYGSGTVTPSATAIDGSVTFAYSRNEKGPFTATVPTEAGVWYCQATSEAIGDYTADTQVTSFRIIGTPNQIKDFEIGDVKTGGTVAPTAKADVGDVTFLYSTSEEGPFTETAPTEEGTYYVKAVSINKDGIESQSAVKQFRIYTPTFIDNICEKTGLTPTVVYIIIAAIVVVILIIILVIYCKGKKKTKNKIKKGAKNVAKDLGIDIPKAPSSSSTKKSSSSTKKSTSSSKSSSSKSSTSKSTTKKK